MWAWLGKVESMGRSFSAYAPAVVVHKLLDYARVLLLTWFVGKAEFGIWALGSMVFIMASTVSTLGTSQSIARYVSFYQARGQLVRFFRRAALGVCLVGLAVVALGVLGAGGIAELLAVTKPLDEPLIFDVRFQIVMLGLLNGLLLALYNNLHSCIRAMRTFHLLAALEVGFSLVFTAAALGAAAAGGGGISILWAHAGSLAGALLVGGVAAYRCLGYVTTAPRQGEEAIGEEGAVVPEGEHPAPGEQAQAVGADGTPILYRLLRFGFVAMLATLAWQAGNFLSRWMTNRFHGPAEAGVYSALQTFCQPAWILSGIIWGLVFSHLASHWESNKRWATVRMANVTFKAVVLVLMTGTVLVLATGRWWQLLLAEGYRREDLRLLAGLLMFYQCSANLGLATMVAKLRERPIVIVGIFAVGVAVNAVLGWLWIPTGGALAAAQAAGIGMLTAVALGTVYLLAAGFRVHPAAHVLALSPALLLAPMPYAAAAWGVVLVAAAATPLIFTAREKLMLIRYVRSIGMRRKGVMP